MYPQILLEYTVSHLSPERHYSSLALPYLRRLVAGFPPRRSRLDPRSSHVGFVVDKVALGQVFCEHFGFPYKFLFHHSLIIL
jgi:hypothetical protein